MGALMKKGRDAEIVKSTLATFFLKKYCNFCTNVPFYIAQLSSYVPHSFVFCCQS